MRRLLPTVFLALASYGCAVRANAPSFAASPLPEMRSDKAVLYVYRKYAEPTAWPAYLEIDGRDALSLQQEGFTWVYVTPGSRNLVYKWPFLARMPRVQFTHDFEAGKTYVFEMTGKARGALVFFVTRSAIREVEWRAASEELRACCRYVPANEMSF